MKVLVVDSQILFREGLSSLIQKQPDIIVVGEASSCIEAVSKAFELKPDIMLMDVGSEVQDGLNAIKMILSQQPEIRIIILSHHDSDALLLNALKYGAKGFLLKTSNIGVITTSLRAVMDGEVALSRKMMRHFLDELTRQESKNDPFQTYLDKLTTRELEILGYIASGATNRQIAKRLFISENTVKIHVHNILEKLNLNNRREIAKLAHLHDLMSS